MVKSRYPCVSIKLINVLKLFILTLITPVFLKAQISYHKDSILAYQYLQLADSLNKMQLYDSSNHYYFKSAELFYAIVSNKTNNLTGKILLSNDLWNKYITCRLNMAWNYMLKSEFQNSITLLNNSIDNSLKYLDSNYCGLSGFYNILGTVYNYMSNYDSALYYFNQAMNRNYSCYPPNDVRIIKTLNNIGTTYRYKGDYELAMNYYNRIMEICLSANDSMNEVLGYAYNNAGLVFIIQGKYEQGLEYYDKSLNIKLSSSDINPLTIAMTYNNIGNVYYNLADNDWALMYHKKALRIRLDVHKNETNADVAMSYGNIANIYLQMKESDNALYWHNKALEIMNSIYDEKHPAIALELNNIGNVYKENNDYINALNYYQKSLEIFTDRKSEIDDEHIGSIMNNIGVLYSFNGEYKKCMTVLDSAYNIYFKKFGFNHPLIGATFNNKANIYFNWYNNMRDTIHNKSVALLDSALLNYQYSMFSLIEANDVAKFFLNLEQTKRESGVKIKYKNVSDKVILLETLTGRAEVLFAKWVETHEF